MIHPEARKVLERYARRPQGHDLRYSILDPSVWQTFQERQRVLIQMLSSFLGKAPAEATVLEIGCGTGMNLLELLRLGFRPENLVGNELLADRAREAQHLLPAATRIMQGDALALPFAEASFDIVYQSTVFTSLLDDAFQEALAARMWSWVKPGGGILWYDFVYNNPNNRDVRGVTLRRIRSLFPEGHVISRRVTLAPPIARRATRLHPYIYNLLNRIPLLRTHVLCWIGKHA